MTVVEDFEITPDLLAKAKDFLRIDSDYTGEDETVTTLLKAAIEVIEGATNLSLFPRVLRDDFDTWNIKLPYGPHGDNITVTNADGDTIPAEEYTVSGSDFKSISFPSSGYHFFYPINGDPIVESRVFGSCPRVTVEFDSGYEPDKLPSGLLHLVLRLTDYYYTNRGSYTVSLPKDISTESRRYARQIIL